MSDDAKTEPVKKKGKLGKILMLVVGGLVLAGGGVGGGLYAAGVLGGGEHAEKEDKPRLVPKSEEVRASAGAEGGGDHGGDGEEGESGGDHEGKPTPEGEGGDEYASTYYPLEKEFTSNLQNSVHFIQVGIAVSTSYDNKVIDNLKTHEIAVRSAVLMSLGETPEEEVFTAQGKKQLQRRLAKAINDTLKQKEGFGGIGNVYFTNFVVQ